MSEKRHLILNLETCYDCPHRSGLAPEQSRCKITLIDYCGICEIGKIIDKAAFGIPDWCPLPKETQSDVLEKEVKEHVVREGMS
jgi:hypothetical protein